MYPILPARCGVVRVVDTCLGMGMRLLAVTALVLGAAATPAVAATVAPLKPCYVSAGDTREQRENVLIQGEGFTPEGFVDILVNGIVEAQPQADASGNISGTIDAPFQDAGEVPFEIVVRDRINPLVSITLRSRVSALDARLRPRDAPSDSRVRMLGRGFTRLAADGRRAPLFAHYMFGGTWEKTVRLARRSKGRCGRAIRRPPPADPDRRPGQREVDRSRSTSGGTTRPCRDPSGSACRLPSAAHVPRAF